jgi:hypothetical protein
VLEGDELLLVSDDSWRMLAMLEAVSLADELLPSEKLLFRVSTNINVL